MTETAIILLAAGQGTRMRSNRPKVLHKAGGRTLLGHVLAAAAVAQPRRTVVVVGPGMADAEAEARRLIGDVSIAIQAERRGTAHAVSTAESALAGFSGTVLVLYGDVPLISPGTIKRLAESVTLETPLAVLA